MRYLLTIALLLLLWPVFGQQTDGTVTIRNAELTVLSGTNIYIKGHFNDSTLGTQLTDGRDYEGAVSSSGNIYVGKGLFNKGEQKFNITQGRIIFNGTDIQAIDGNPVEFYDLELDKDTAMVPYQFIEVKNVLDMTRGYVNLDSIISGIDLGLTGQLVGEADDKRIFGEEGRLFARERNLSAAANDIAGLGVSTNGTLGLTDLDRFNIAQAGSTDKGSISKYFSLKPTNKNATLSSASMTYFDADITGFDERIFALWNSTNQGVVWNRSVGTVNTASNLVSGQNIRFGNDVEELLTVADSVCTSGPIVSLHPTDEIAICDGESFVLDAGNPGLFFLWNTGATTQQITVTAPGEYYVRVTDANGCYGTDTVDVIEKPFPVVDFNLNFECLGQKSIFTNTTTLSDPSGSLTYEWELNDGQGIITDINPETTYANIGQYEIKLTATSDFNCVASETKTYVVHPLPEVAFTAGQVCEGIGTSFANNSTILPSIGLINYAVTNYDWDFGVVDVTDDVSIDTSPTYTYPAAGEYTVELIAESNAGCKDSTKVIVVVNPVPVADFTAADFCIGADIEIDNLSSISAGSLTYAWDFGDVTTANVPFPPKSYDEAGKYDVTMTATSNLNCSAEVTKTVEAYAIPNVSFNFSDQCEGETVQFTNESTIDGDDDMTFQWTFEDGQVSENTDIIRTFNEPGDYTVTLVANTPNQCTAVTTRQINIYPVPVADFSVDNICLGETIRPNNKSSIASGEMNYTWSIDGNEVAEGRNPALNITQSGIHEITLEVVSQNFCRDVVTKEIEVYDLPVLDIPDQISTCGDQITLDAGADGISYLWSDNSRGQTLTVTRNGTYQVTVTNASGCTVTASTTVSLDSEFIPNLPERIEACDEVILDAGNPGSQSYQWSTGSNARLIEVIESGIYSVDIIDQNGCLGSQEIEVIISASPVLDLPTSITACSDEAIVLDTGQPNLTHQWSTGEISSSIKPLVSGRYSVIVTTPEGCSATAGVDVVINPASIVELGEDRIACDMVTLSAGNEGSTYLWSDGSTDQTLTSTLSGQYWVAVTNAFGCTVSDTVNIDIANTSLLDLPESITLCSGESTVLDAGNTNAQFLWSTGAVSQQIEVSATGAYEVTVTNSAGCTVTEKVDVFVTPRVEVDLGPDRTICVGSELVLTANIPNANYNWSNNDGVFSTDRSVVLDTSGDYFLEVESLTGCIGRDTLSLSVSQDTLTSRFLVTSEAFVGDTIQFTSISVPTESNHFWRFGDGVTSVKEDPQHIFFRAGTYDLSLTISKDGCTDSSEKSITINEPNAGRLESFELEEEVNLFITPLLKDTLATVNIYPNVFQDQFTIELDKAKESSLLLLFHDLNGKLWYAEEFDKIKSLTRTYDWSTLPSGMYVISFITNEERITRRIIKN